MENKTLIVYKSVTGFTREYAETAAAGLGCPCAALKAVSPRDVPEGGTLVFGGRLHAGRVDGLRQALKLYRASRAARLVVFATGASPAVFGDVVREMWQNNLSPELLENVPHFYFPSGLRYDKMGPGDRLMMRALGLFMRRKKNKSEYERRLEQMISHSYDISSPKYLEPMLSLLHSADKT